MDTIRRDFLPSDLLVTLRGAGIDGAIAVQARQTVEETEWLLHLSDTYDFIRGVVGWVPLTEPALEVVLERVCEHRQLKGVRHVIHDEPDDEFMLRANFNKGIQQLQTFGLMFAPAFLTSGAIVGRRLQELGQTVDWAYQMIFSALAGGLIGSRLVGALRAVAAVEVEIEDVLDALHIHRQPFEAVSQFARHRRAFEAGDLLEVGELRDLHAVAPAFPAQPPRAQRRTFPVVFDETDVMNAGIDPDRREGLQV